MQRLCWVLLAAVQLHRGCEAVFSWSAQTKACARMSGEHSNIWSENTMGLRWTFDTVMFPAPMTPTTWRRWCASSSRGRCRLNASSHKVPRRRSVEVRISSRLRFHLVTLATSTYWYSGLREGAGRPAKIMLSPRSRASVGPTFLPSPPHTPEIATSESSMAPIPSVAPAGR